jgi:sensor c-di-GMP phosphodiesterase-like protein
MQQPPSSFSKVLDSRLNVSYYFSNGECDTVQGYYFSKPLPIDELITFLEGV